MLILSNGLNTKKSYNWIFLRCYARWKCGYTQLEAATINHLHAPVTTFIFGCSGTIIYDPEVRDEDSFQPWDNTLKIHLFQKNLTDWLTILFLTWTGNRNCWTFCLVLPRCTDCRNFLFRDLQLSFVPNWNDLTGLGENKHFIKCFDYSQ